MQNKFYLTPEIQKQNLTFFQIFIVIWSTSNILFGGVPMTGGFYFNHILILLLFIIAVLVKPKILAYKIFWLIVFVMFIFSTSSYLVDGFNNPRFFQEHFKLLLILLGSLAICNSVNWKIVNLLTILLPSLLLTEAIIVSIYNLGFYYGNSMSFGIPVFGGPNTTGFVLSLAICSSLYNVVNPERSSSLRIFSCLLFFGLFLTLYNTNSDAALISTLLVFLRYIGLKLNKIFYILFFIFIISLLLIWSGYIILPELAGSGRLFIWALLLSDYIFSSPINWIFGFGPGGVNIEPDFTRLVQSAHSTYIEILYSYGLFGLIILVLSINLIYKKIKKQYISNSRQKFIDSIFLITVVSFLFDTHFLTAHISWIGSLIIGISISRMPFFKYIRERRL